MVRERTAPHVAFLVACVGGTATAGCFLEVGAGAVVTRHSAGFQPLPHDADANTLGWSFTLSVGASFGTERGRLAAGIGRMFTKVGTSDGGSLENDIGPLVLRGDLLSRVGEQVSRGFTGELMLWNGFSDARDDMDRGFTSKGRGFGVFPGYSFAFVQRQKAFRGVMMMTLGLDVLHAGENNAGSTLAIGPGVRFHVTGDVLFRGLLPN
jgi:hypothetical protein